jgi:hypothetical protein
MSASACNAPASGALDILAAFAARQNPPPASALAASVPIPPPLADVFTPVLCPVINRPPSHVSMTGIVTAASTHVEGRIFDTRSNSGARAGPAASGAAVAPTPFEFGATSGADKLLLKNLRQLHNLPQDGHLQPTSLFVPSFLPQRLGNVPHDDDEWGAFPVPVRSVTTKASASRSREVKRTKKTLNDTCDISYLSGDAAGGWSGCILIAILSCRANNLMQNADATVNKGGVRNFELWRFHVEELDNQPSYSQEHEVAWMNKEALLHLMERGFYKVLRV